MAESVPIERQFPAYPTTMDINHIRDSLPHRFSFFLVDKVIDYVSGKTAVGIKNVSINDNLFPGHFSKRPILSGVLLLEATAHVGGLVLLQAEVGDSRWRPGIAASGGWGFTRELLSLRGSTKCGSEVCHREGHLGYEDDANTLQERFGIVKLDGKAYVGGEVVCEGEFLLATSNSCDSSVDEDGFSHLFPDTTCWWQ